MRIYIPTLGRPRNQATLSQLPPSLRKETVLVIQPHEERDYHSAQPDVDKLVLPPDVKGIGNTRQWICDIMNKPFIMMDDDLAFATRRKDMQKLFRPSAYEDIEEMVYEMKEESFTHPHIGVSPREGANFNTNPYKFNDRIIRVHLVNPQWFRAHNIRWDRCDTKEDFDVTLQVLRTGQGNIVMNKWVHNQRGSNAEGGCATYRDIEYANQISERLHELHPEYVTVVEKTTKTAWGGATRKDVRIQWKKAYKDGKSQ